MVGQHANSCIKIAHLNIRSLKSREHFLLPQHTVEEHDFDIFTISETWLDSSVDSQVMRIPGFAFFHQDRGEHKSGGLAVYIKDTFRATLLKDVSGISDENFPPVPFAKDLGVYIDQYLPYDVHFTKTASNCMNQLVHIRRIKHLLNKKTLLLLINSFVFSKLFYCSLVWGNTSKRNLHKLQLVQNFAARVVLRLWKFEHISLGRRSLGWLDVTEKILFNDLVLALKCVNRLFN